MFDAEHFVLFADIFQGENVLEVGVGGGNTCRLISEITNNCTFMDFCQKAVDAQKRKCPHLNITCGDILDSGLNENSYDKILARYVIHNFPAHSYRTRFYAEVARLLKDNGDLVLGMVPNRLGMCLDLKNYIDPKLRHRLAREHGTYWPLSIGKMKRELRGLGFKLVDIRKTPEPAVAGVYCRFRQLLRRFFLPVFCNVPILYYYVDLKFKKIQ